MKYNDLNAHLKSGDIAKKSFAPNLYYLITDEKRAMRKNIGGNNSARDIICEAMTNNKQFQVTKQKTEEILISDVKIGEKYITGGEGKSVFATGYKYNDRGEFIVLAGSTISGTIAPTMQSSHSKIRVKCIDDGTIVSNRFTKDYLFKSWSAAASVIYGCNKSGPEMWKREE